MVPPDIRHDRIAKFTLLETDIEDGLNPIVKVQIIASEVNGQVSLDQLPTDGDNGDGATGGTPLAQLTTQWRTSILSKTQSMQVAVDTMHQQQIAEFALLKRRQKRLEEMIRGMIVAPARRAGPLIVVGGGIRTGDPTPTDPRCPKLMSCPRSLGVLWEEWQNGIAGSKPARLYNARERGRNKSRYCRRLVFWKCMKRLCDRGCTVNSRRNQPHCIQNPCQDQ